MSDVSSFYGPPSSKVRRRRAIAQALMQHANEPVQPDIIAGQQFTSPWASLGKALEKGVAGYAQGRVMKSEEELGKQRASMLMGSAYGPNQSMDQRVQAGASADPEFANWYASQKIPLEMQAQVQAGARANQPITPIEQARLTEDQRQANLQEQRNRDQMGQQRQEFGARMGLNEREFAFQKAQAGLKTEAATTEKSMEIEKEQQSKIQRITEMDVTLKNIREAKKMVGPLSAGLGANVKWISGTSAYNLDQALEPLRAFLTIDKVMQLKQLSAVGSTGFGQLAVSEGNKLAGYIGSLEPGQSEENLKNNLKKIEGHINNLRDMAMGKKPKGYIQIGGKWLDMQAGFKPIEETPSYEIPVPTDLGKYIGQ